MPVELHCWPGAFHGFGLVPTAQITQRASAALQGALRRGLSVDLPAVPAAADVPAQLDPLAVVEAATGV